MDELTRRFIAWESTTRDTIDFKRVYVDIAQEDFVAGALLSQLVYWFLPDRNGDPRLEVCRDGRLWLVKKREDWWEEIRLRPKRFDRAMRILEELGYVEVAVHKRFGTPQNHIWVNLEAVAHAVAERVKSKFPNWEGQSSPSGNVDIPETGISSISKKTTYREDSPNGAPESEPVFDPSVIEPDVLEELKGRILQTLHVTDWDRTAPRMMLKAFWLQYQREQEQARG